MPKKKVYKPPKVTVYKPEKPKIKPSFKPRSRFPGIADKFFRYFTMFLVFLVLFAVVSGAEYDAYKTAVRGIYSATETIGAFTSGALSVIMKGLDIYDNDYDIADGTLIDVSIKISGEWYQFVAKANYRPFGFIFSRGIRLEILEAPIEYVNWKGEYFYGFLAWLRCPDNGIRKYSMSVKEN